MKAEVVGVMCAFFSSLSLAVYFVSYVICLSNDFNFFFLKCFISPPILFSVAWLVDFINILSALTYKHDRSPCIYLFLFIILLILPVCELIWVQLTRW